MHDAVFVQYLLHDDGGLGFGEALVGCDPVEELAARAELHHQVNVARVLVGFVELDDVGMIHEFHDLDFLLECILVRHRALLNTWER